MSLSGIPTVVRVVNRVVDANGQRVPTDIYFGGEAVKVHDHIDLPLGVARIVIHQSMYRLDPLTTQPAYRLGCVDLGAPTDDLPASALPDELIDRASLPGKVERRVRPNPTIRTEPLSVRTLGAREDGAFPGFFDKRV